MARLFTGRLICSGAECMARTNKPEPDKDSLKNNLVEFAPEFAVDLIDPITQIHRNSELFRGLLRMKIG